MAEHESIRNKVATGIITAAILAVAGYVGRAWLPPIWDFTLRFVRLVWSWLFAGHPVYGWLIIVLALCAVFCSCLLLAALFRRKPQGYSWRSYRRDIFFGLVWRWDYFGQDIGQPSPYCIHCDTQLIPQEDYDYGNYGRKRVAYYICDHCNGTNLKLDESFRDTQNKAIRQVDRKLRNDEWKIVVSNSPANA